MSITLFKAIPSAASPTPASRTAQGRLPERACWSAREASARGWYCFSPVSFDLDWDGAHSLGVSVHGEALDQLDLGGSCTPPEFSSTWDASAPEHLRGELYPILSRSPDVLDMIQIWTGLVMEIPPMWAVEIRPPVNSWEPDGYYVYTGTFAHTGPLFVSIRLTRPGRIEIPMARALAQVQPMMRSNLSEPAPHPVAFRDWVPQDFDRYEKAVVQVSRARSKAAANAHLTP